MGLTLDLDLKKCTSCGACAIACMDQNDIDVERGIRPFRTVFDWESREPGCQKFIHISIACMHCPDAPCVAACPSACIAKDPETNLTIFDNTNCIGCHSCAMPALSASRPSARRERCRSAMAARCGFRTAWSRPASGPVRWALCAWSPRRRSRGRIRKTPSRSWGERCWSSRPDPPAAREAAWEIFTH